MLTGVSNSASRPRSRLAFGQPDMAVAVRLLGSIERENNMRRNYRRFAQVMALGATFALGAGLLVTPATAQVNASRLPNGINAKLPGLPKTVTIKPVDVNAGARRLGVAAGEIFAQSTREGTLNVTLYQPEPYARIVPVTGDPYLISAGDITQYFSALMGPAPAIGISYGTKDRQRTLDFTQMVTPPVYDINTRTITFQLEADMAPISGSHAAVTFIATDPNWRPDGNLGANLLNAKSAVKVTSATPVAKALRGTTPTADAPASYTVSSTLGAATAPARLLTATQQTFTGGNCITYDSPGATGGTNTTVSGLSTYSTSTQVSQSVNAGASVSEKYGGLHTSLSASYAEDTTQNSASVYAVAEVASAGMTTNLTPRLVYRASTLGSVEDGVRLISNCGDSVATSYTSGSQYQAVLQMKTASQSQATTLKASLSASYSTVGTSTSGSGTFAGTVASSSSVSQVAVTEMCVGPVNGCAGVPGYQPLNLTSVNTALDSFSSNYTAMTAGLGTLCQSQAGAGSCVVELQYVPIESLIDGSLSLDPNAKANVSKASTGVYWMLTNTMNWANGYQSLANAYNTAATYTRNGIYSYAGPSGQSTPATADQLGATASDYQNTADRLLTWAGLTCGGVKLGSSDCIGTMVACANVASSATGAASACLPSAIPTITGIPDPKQLADPSTLAGPQFVSPPTTCDQAVPSARYSGNYNQQTTLYLGGMQPVNYNVWCVWTNGSVNTYLSVNASSQTEFGTTTYSWAQFDPATGALYATPMSIPSNAPSGLLPSCPASGCAPLGYAEAGKNQPAGSTSTMSVTLPTNLAFASTTVPYGTGNATLVKPSSIGLSANAWQMTQPRSGTLLLTDSKYTQSEEGISFVVPSNPNYKFTTTAIPVSTGPNPSTSCALGSSGSASNSGVASSQSNTTDVRNQQIWYAGTLDGNPKHCKVWLKETSYKHHGTASWTDSGWYVNSEYGPLYPTFICGYSTEGNGELKYSVSAGDPNSMSVTFAASTASSRDPTLTVWIQYDNVNTHLDKSGAYVGGMCNETSNNTNMPIDGHIEY